MNKKLSSLKKGFTLIELLVVITIIGILTAAGLVFFANAQKSGRDARRQADVRGIANAYEQYFSSNGAYPALATGIDTTAYFPSAARPVDPRNVAPYQYSYFNSTAGYCVCAAFENLGKGNATAAATAVACAFGTPAAGAQGYFCQQSRQ